jgi:hypothetical protein
MIQKKNRVRSLSGIALVTGVAIFVALSLTEESRFLRILWCATSNSDVCSRKATAQPMILWSNESSTTSIVTNATTDVTEAFLETSSSIVAVPANNATNKETMSMNQLTTLPSSMVIIASNMQKKKKNPSPPSPTRAPRTPRNITVIVELRGELGNHLSVLANARITQLIAQRHYPHIHIQLIGQHQSDPKWVLARDDLVRCFPNFRNFEFHGGIHDTKNDFFTMKRLQDSWLSTGQREKLTNVKSFAFLDSLLYQQEQNVSDAPQLPPTTHASRKYSLPYLTAKSFSWFDVLKNEYYYNDIREWMRLNETACCNPNIAPKSNEIVFHYRNFITEFKNKRFYKKQFVEVTPYTAANALFLNTSTDHPIAISSRFPNRVDQYVQALQKRGISSYYVDGQRTGMEAFCYLLQAQYELVGMYQSTFVRWAALLGNATMNRSYLLDQKPLEQSNTTILLPPPVRTGETIQREQRTFTTEVYWQAPA